ncbi:SMP-30/gluconolactonase/LRE family protein [Sinorhizobium meliloti]|uniref:SMP-30/gluconolactonase/LRE family protein n=1 Tax=Rhizobium meliloti TaxID=382 RepID=UPI003F17AAF1
MTSLERTGPPPAIDLIGYDLARPECILAMRGGTLIVTDKRAGVSVIHQDGSQRRVGSIEGVPNGIALDRDGTLLVAEIENGALYRLSPDGRTTKLLDTLDGKRLGSANFVHVDDEGRIWLTVSTRTEPRSLAIAAPIPDGYLARIDGNTARTVLSGLCFPNEIRIDHQQGWLYIAESSLGRIIRCRLDADGMPGRPEVFGPQSLFSGAVVDGITFDAEGGLWVTEVTRNGLYRLDPSGKCTCYFEDPHAKLFEFPASLAFGGANLQTGYLGTIRMNQIGRLELPIAGRPMPHWNSFAEPFWGG